ncbi:hemerythrin domain-containing protein [Anaerococcus cruorum]|uniref:hemerythrin domain-containing protein n=1 Tax=Anaerococcus sp. WGS1529 TaxID=3366812 RepID=UPI00372D6B9C
MNYLKLNEQAHSEVKDLIEKVKSSDGKTKENAFYKVYAKLAGHHEAEEKILFPKALEKCESIDDKDTILEMPEEHSVIMFQLGVLNNTPFDNETWDAKFSVFEEIGTHHMDEEEDEFAKVAKKLFTDDELEDIGAKVEEEMNAIQKEWLDKLKK